MFSTALALGFLPFCNIEFRVFKYFAMIPIVSELVTASLAIRLMHATNQLQSIHLLGFFGDNTWLDDCFNVSLAYLKLHCSRTHVGL